MLSDTKTVFSPDSQANPSMDYASLSLGVDTSNKTDQRENASNGPDDIKILMHNPDVCKNLPGRCVCARARVRVRVRVLVRVRVCASVRVRACTVCLRVRYVSVHALACICTCQMDLQHVFDLFRSEVDRLRPLFAAQHLPAGDNQAHVGQHAAVPAECRTHRLPHRHVRQRLLAGDHRTRVSTTRRPGARRLPRRLPQSDVEGDNGVEMGVDVLPECPLCAEGRR